MTTFRKPAGWRDRPEGQRPDLASIKWLANCCKTTREYWIKLHWATPPWMTDDHWAWMRSIYARANSKFQHVDHTVPLKHPLVCGLNVPWNLGITTARANMSKGNRWWPDCPDHLCPDKNLPPDMFGEAEPHQTSLPL